MKTNIAGTVLHVADNYDHRRRKIRVAWVYGIVLFWENSVSYNCRVKVGKRREELLYGLDWLVVLKTIGDFTTTAGDRELADAEWAQIKGDSVCVLGYHEVIAVLIGCEGDCCCDA